MKQETFNLLVIVLTIISLSLALVSLTASIFTWLLTGSRPKVTVHPGMRMYPGGGGPSSDELFLRISVRNKGRTQIDVDNWFIEWKTGEAGFFGPGSPGNRALPHTLAPGASVSFFASQKELLDKRTPPLEVRGLVSFGDGRDVRSRWVTIERGTA